MSANSSAAMQERTPGEVVTFYSYKGGTGRTMSMVNLACLLADRLNFGERILLIDWDLEAPGLHRYFHGRLRPAFARDKPTGTSEDASDFPGLIDLFCRLRETGDSPSLKRKRRQDVRAETLLDAVKFDDYLLGTHLPNLDMIKAGRFDAGYGARVNTFPWEGFFNEYPLAFRVLAERLKNRYRYVFIDSRTGQTDTAGICTTLMPEKLVLVFTPNRQSLFGIETVLKDAVAYRRRDQDARPLVAYPLPSRIEVAQDDLRRKWRFGDSAQNLEGYEPFLTKALKDAYGIKHCHLKRFFDEVQIKQSPVYAFGEEIAVLNERMQKVEDDYSLTRAYQNLLAWLEPGYLPWESPEAIRLMRSLENRARARPLEAVAFAEDLSALRALAKRFATDGDSGNAELAVRMGEAYARKSLGETHVESLAFRGALVQLFTEQGKFATARGMAEKLLAQSTEQLGDPHVDVQQYKSLLATLLEKQGDYAGARTLQESALAIRRRVLGDEHPDTLSSMANLAGTLRSQGDLRGARALQEQVLALRRRVLGDEHPDTLTSMANLAGTLRSQGDLPGARALEEPVLALRRRILGDEHPNTLTSMGNLASTLGSQGDLPGARALQEQVLALCRRILGDEHPDTLGSMADLAGTLGSQGDLPGARALEEQVLAISRRVLGDEHPDTLSSMANLASTLRSQGDLPGARALEEQVLTLRRRVLGDEHPDTLGGMRNLIATLWDANQQEEARDMAKSLYGLYRKVNGPQHETTVTTGLRLLQMYGELGDKNAANLLIAELASEKQARP